MALGGKRSGSGGGGSCLWQSGDCVALEAATSVDQSVRKQTHVD